jgi:hypothetical protein
MVSSAFANLFFSTAPLLSGDLDGCPALPTLGEDCVGGLASVAAVMRRSALAGDGPALFAPALDRQSRLVHVSYRNTVARASKTSVGWRAGAIRPASSHSFVRQSHANCCYSVCGPHSLDMIHDTSIRVALTCIHSFLTFDFPSSPLWCKSIEQSLSVHA